MAANHMIGRPADHHAAAPAAAAAVTNKRNAFSLHMSSSEEADDDRSSPLSTVIYANVDDFNHDPGQGGVRLAEESALLLKGTVPPLASSGSKQGGDNNRPKPSELIRYKQLTPITELSQPLVQVIATGIGKELYKDPGEGTEQVIELAPFEAVKDLWNKVLQSEEVNSLMDPNLQHVHVSIVGGDDLQVLEVLDALAELRQALDNTMQLSSNNNPKKNVPVLFSSLTHASFPLEQVTMTLVAVLSRPSDGSDDDDDENNSSIMGARSGIDKAVADGQIFISEGKYWTVVEEDINPALE
ncbi:hypothetical protein ACA910_017129 [Epithemia clementina (nom. ined.)]